ncbi:MAG: carbamoyl-phosphate synthase large subunit, partial [Alistipes sp.]|nr:carbamoyl-phosphate synthase large subunit [Alistipes sp.]
PRWDLGKFKGVSRELGSSMKSVGEVMAIGRNFEECMQKGLRMIGQGMHGFVANKELAVADLDEALSKPTDKRIFHLANAFKAGYTVDRIWELTKIDRWFLHRLEYIISLDNELGSYNSLAEVPDALLLEAKQRGFSDFQIAREVLKPKDGDMEKELAAVRTWRKSRGITPVIKRIDTLAAEYPATTNYLYVTYNGTKHDIDFTHDGQSVVVLGSGAYRIGSSVEFDWCSVNAASTIRNSGLRSIMINYNPETVSTDYDMSDRLYFDELTLERVLDITDLEAPRGVVVSMGGQIPNNLAMRLDANGVKLLGTSAANIDRAEDRHKFSKMCDELGIDQPRWKELSSLDEIYKFADEVGFPLLIRPSYVLSGAAMNVVSNRDELEHFLTLATNVSKQHPVVVTEYLTHAKEIEIDAVARDGEVQIYAISEHVEYAGVHSGDATMVFPAQKMYVETARRVKKIAREVAKGLQITGPFNMQLMAKNNDIKVIECNLRASRSFPFVSKVLKVNFIELATKVMLGEKVDIPQSSAFELDYVGIKAPQFSFSRLQKTDPVLGVEMASTGEVGCLGDDYSEAILKSMISVGYAIPRKNILLSTGDARSKTELLGAAKSLQAKGYNLFATRGTADYLASNGVTAEVLAWPDSPEKPNTLDYIRERKVDLVVNIPKNLSAAELSNDYTIRRSAIDFNVPLITNSRLASAYIDAFCRLSPDDIKIKAWDEY